MTLLIGSIDAGTVPNRSKPEQDGAGGRGCEAEVDDHTHRSIDRGSRMKTFHLIALSCLYPDRPILLQTAEVLIAAVCSSAVFL